MKQTNYCFSHNPDSREAKKMAVTKGGRSPKKNYNPLPPFKLQNNKNVAKLLAQTINEVRQGQIELRVANCIGYLAGILVKTFEVSDLEERINNIEKLLPKHNQNRS